MATQQEDVSVDEAWRGLFEDRYGPGSFDRLVSLLRQPCVTFARVADQYGVTRECVRQWHQRLLPEGPRGHERQRLCRDQQRKRRLLEDGLFLGFYRRVRSYVPGQRVTLIPARDGFRKRTVRIDGRTVLLRRARRSVLSPRVGEGVAYTLVSGDVRADFIYYELSTAEYLLVPKDILPAGTTTFLDTAESRYQRFKNTLAALLSESPAEQAS